MKIIAIANQKGGTGKTTTTVNLAAALVRANRTVLLVDMDPQGSLTEYFVNPAELNFTIYNALLDGAAVAPLQIKERMYLIPADIDLTAAEMQLPVRRNYEHTLARILQCYTDDFCLIDCPPSFGVLTANALTAAHLVLVPVSTELMAERTVKLILNTIEDIRKAELNPTLSVWRILPTLFDARLTHHREILEVFHTKYGSLLYPDPVKATTKYKDAVTSQTDVNDLDSRLGAYWDELANVLINEAINEAMPEARIPS